MNDLSIEATVSSPSVHLSLAEGLASLAGESYPENAFDYYAPIIAWIKEFLATRTGPLKLELRLSYLNTSSTKCLVDILDELENAHTSGREVGVVWYCERGNERAQESAEEFREDVELPFDIVLEEPES